MNVIDVETGEIIGDEQALALLDGHFRFTPAGLVVQGDPSFEEWEAVGDRLAYIQRRIHWWIGDWLNYGEGRWGERYAQAIDETKFRYQTLANDKWVAGKVELSRRRENLRFSHHAEVASRPPEEQDRWLDRAEREGWGPGDLRREIVKERLLAQADGEVTLSVAMTFRVPTALNGKLRDSLERLALRLAEWDIECTQMSIEEES